MRSPTVSSGYNYSQTQTRNSPRLPTTRKSSHHPRYSAEEQVPELALTRKIYEDFKSPIANLILKQKQKYETALKTLKSS